MPRKPPYRPTRGPRRRGPKVTREMRDKATAPKVRYVKPNRARIRGKPPELDIAPLWTTQPDPPDAVQGESYFYSLGPLLNTTFQVVITVGAGALPDGITIDGTNLVGTPTTSGLFPSTTLVATNTKGSDECDEFSINITAFAWATTPTPPAGEVGTAYSYDMAVHLNSTENVTLSATPLTTPLPDGLSYSGTRIVGTPTSSGNVTGIQTNANNGTANVDSAAYAINVAELAPVWLRDPPLVTDGQIGVVYSYDFSADLNAASGVTVTETGAGTLPAGLSITGTVLSGTPTGTSGTASNLQFTATNTGGSAQSAVTDIAIAPPVPNWDSQPNPPDGQTNAQYDYDFAPLLNTTDGVVITETGAGSLPPGIAISGLTLTGIPTAEGTYSNLQFTATNSAGSDQSNVVDIVIALTLTVGIRLDNPVQSTKEVLDQGTETVTGAVTGDFGFRSTMPGTLYAHSLQNQAELDNFIRLGANTNPDTAGLPNPLTLVPSGLEDTQAIRTRAVGSLITSDLASVPKLTTGFTIPVDDATRFPDPASIGAYNIFIGCTDDVTQDTNPVVFEECTLTSISGNNLIVTRNIGNYSIRVDGVNYSSGSANAPAIQGSSGNYTIGYTNSGSWNRPMCSFPATQNGRASDDVGILNGYAAKTRTWDPTQNGTGHAYFREGYFGHRHYWDENVNPAAPYKDWTPTNTGDGQNFPHPDAYEGDEFFQSFRFKATDSRLQSTISKLLYIQNAATSGVSQLFFPIGQTRYNEQPDPADKQAGTVSGCFIGTNAGGGDSRQPAGGYFGHVFQDTSWDFPGTGTDGRWQTDYPLGNHDNRNDVDCYAFCHQSDTWVEMQIHMKLGRCNAESTHVGGVGSGGVNPPWPGDTDATYLTRLHVEVSLPGDKVRKVLCDIDDCIWFYGDNLGEVGNLFYNAAGINTFWMTQEFNMYIGAGSVAPPVGYAETLFAQPICSRHPISIPETNTTMDDIVRGMAVNEWVEFTGSQAWPGGTSAFWVPGGGSSEAATNFAHVGAHDPVRKQVVFAGAGYGNAGFYVYDQHAETWTKYEHDYMIHSWDHFAYDVSRGEAHYGRQSGGVQRTVDMDDPSTAATLSDFPFDNSDTYGMCWFPPLDGVLFAHRDGRVFIRPHRTGVSELLASGATTKHLDNFAAYNPVTRTVYMGGGQNTPTVFQEIDEVGNISDLPLNTANPGVDCARQKVFCGDVTGNAILIDFPAGEVHQYQRASGWSEVTTSFPSVLIEAGARTAAIPLQGYGDREVVMCLRADANIPSNVYCYLYRYS